MNCNDKKKFRTSEASSKASLRTKGAIDKFLNILDTNLFRKYNKQWSQDARERFGISGSLFYEENNKAIPNKEAFQKIDKAKKQHNGTQYQLESNLINPAIEELDNFLLDFLRNFNVKSKQFDELKSRLGVDALGATDILNKLIWYTKNRNEETLPEEAAHMLVALMGENHPDIKELLANVSNWDEYQSIKDQYLPIYKDENKVKIEAIGKLIAKALVKNYKANGLDKNKLQKVLENILNFIENILNSLNISDAFFYNENIADHIAINVLSGNKDYIYNIKNFNPNLNAKKEINNNPHAKKIISTFSSSSVKMTGSLAIAGTENIRRPKGQGIHDIDFKVKSFEVFNKEILPKIPENAVPAHFGWHKRDYSTFAYLIPTEGYRIEVVERKDDFSNGWITDYKLYNEKNEQVEITQQNIISVDFFVYKEGVSPKDFDFSSNFIPASLVYEGKMSLGGKSNPYFFSRDKDQEDYVLRNPKSFIPFEKHIYYQLNNNSQESLGNIKKQILEEEEKFKKEGITLNQKTKIGIINKLIYRTVSPVSYDIKKIIAGMAPALVFGRNFEDWKKSVEQWSKIQGKDRPEWIDEIGDEQYNKREDAWLLSNGLPQKHNTFKFIGRGFIENGKVVLNPLGEDIYDFVNPNFNGIDIEKDLKKRTYSTDRKNFVMGNYGISSGRDEIGYFLRYTDRWDLDLNNKFIQAVVDATQKPFIVSGKLYKAASYDENGNIFHYYTSNSNNPDINVYSEFISMLGEEEEIINDNKIYENIPVSPKMLKFVKEFIKQIGVDYQKVDKIVVNGKIVDANGIARMMSNLIQVVEGKESVALPEEAMHFAVEIIEQTNPKLFEQMLKDINGEEIYKDVLEQYGKNPYYQKDGKPDIRKLKKEAIGKLLVDKVSSIKAQTWWDKIVKFLKELFNKPQMDGVDSLTQFAEMIVSGEDFGTVNDIKSSEDYFQLNEQDKVFNKLKDLDNQITKEDDGVNDDGNPRQSYFIGDKKIKYRVTDFVSDWYKKIFKGEQTEYQKRLAELKAEEGTKGHYHFEKAFDTFVDPDTGLLREEFLEDDDQYLSTLSQVDKDVYATLKENLRDRLLSFPDGSKFLKEAKIYDGKETAGTVDLLIVEPSGKVSILDWKFIDINTDKYEDVPWYKVKAWNLQMEKYRGILTKNYGVKEEDFKQTRMIPILAMYTDADYQGQNLPKLRGIKIGSVNAQNVNEDYLLYVGFKERTGDEKIDNLLDKMNSVYSKISNEKVSPEDRALKNEQLNSLYKAIRHLEIKKDILPLVNQGKVLNKQVSNFIKKYNDNIKDKSKEELGKETINEFAGMIRAHIEALQPYLDIRQLKYLLDETDPEFSEIKSKLRDTVEDVQDYLDQLQSIDKEFGKKFVGASYTAEKVVKGITRWFGNAATIQLENLQRLFTLANEATAISNFEVSDEVKKLEEIKEKYINWAKSKGLSLRDYFKMIMKHDKNELINQYDSNFYKELKTAVAKKDFRWILDNVDKVEVIKKIKEQEEREIDAALNYPIVGSEEHVKAEINRKIAKIKDKYDVSTSTSKGWLQEQFIKIPTEKWESKEWKTLHEKDSSGNYVNQPAIDFYNYIVEKNKLYKEIGYLTGKSARTFLPWIRKGFLEGVMLDGKPQGSLDQFLRNISVDENETTYGQIDPITGKVIDTIPIHFVNQLEGEYSTDLFSTMFLYNEFAIKYKNLSHVEEQALLLLRAEQNKQSIMTSIFGNVIKKGEGFEFNNNNIENSKLYESFMKSIIYQQKYINNEEFDIMIGKISGFGKKFNEKLGMKIFPENMESRYLTVNKTLDQMNRAFQLQALGLNALSSISNMFGGTANAMINAGKYFTKDDYLKTQAKFLWEKLQGDENAGKILAAVDYFAPFVDNYNKEAKKKLSLAKLTPEGIQDFLMVGLRKGDEMIQYMNAFTFIKNMIVVDGKVKNVREYLRSTDEYKDFYAGNSEQRKARKEKFEKDVNKLIEEKGLLNISKLSENGTLEIPGVERKSDSIIEQRRIIQQFTSDALGSLTEENRRLINMNVYGSSLMVFKNWIPRLVDVRVGGLKYNAAYQAYEWGRYRTFYSMLIPDILKTIKSLTGAVTGNNDAWLEQVRQMFEKQKEEYFNSTGKELKMTESEFISLVNQNIKNQALDLMILTTLLAIGTLAKAMAPDDDEDEHIKNTYRFMLKATDKVTDEVSYFYNPMTPFNLISTKGVFPSVGILNNYAKFLRDFALENYGMIINDDEIVDDAKPIKYLMKSFPVSSQVAAYLPMFYPELAKDLGIKMQSTYGVR